MTRSLAILVLFAVLGAAGLYVGSRFLTSEAPTEVAGRPEPAGPEQGPAQAESSELVAAPELATKPTREVDQGRQAVIEVEQAAAERPETARALFVVDAESGEPLPSALVFAAGVDGRIYDHPGWDFDACDAWLAENGTPIALDAEGRGWVDVSGAEQTLVVGSAPGSWGRTWVEGESEDEIELKLEADMSIRVLVVDLAGSPVPQMPIALRTRSSSWKNDQRVGPTGPDGRREIRHVQNQFRAGDDRRRSVAVAAVLEEPVEVGISIDELPTKEVVLQVPGTGSLEVRVLPMPAGPAVGDGEVELTIHEEGREDMPTFWNRPDSTEGKLVDGLVRFEHVGLGLQVSAMAEGALSTRGTRVVGPGPIAAGTTARLEVTLGSDHPVLRMRILSAEGAPMLNKALKVGLTASSVIDSPGDLASIVTDDEGVLWFDFPRFVDVSSGRSLVIRREANSDEPGASAELNLSRGLVPGLNDFGDVSLGAPRLLVSGRLRRADGTPVADCRVRAQVVRRQEDGDTWYESIDDASDETDEEGRFEIQGAIDGDELRLNARRGKWTVEPTTVPVGTTGVELTAVEAGEVKGRVLVDESINPTDLRVALAPVGNEYQNDWMARRQEDVGPDGLFLVDELRPGTYDLKVTPQSTSESLVTVEGVVVASGTTTTDARLDPVDLRGLLTCFDVVVVAPKATDSIVGVLQIAYFDSQGEEVTKTQFLHGASTTLCFPVDRVDVSVHVQGFRTVHFEDVSEDLRVELEPGIRVRLRLVGEVELPKTPSYLKAFLTAEESPPAWSLGHFQDDVFDSNREIVLYAGASGSHKVLWLFETRSENSLTTTGLSNEEPQVLDVLDVPGEQLFEVTAPAEELAQLVGDG